MGEPVVDAVADAAGREPDPVEEKARAQGWVGKEDFKGKPENWINAETFVKRGEEIVPILRERTKHLEEKLDEQGRTIKDFAEHYKTVNERAYQRAVRDINDKRLKAVQDGDVAAFQGAERELSDLHAARPATEQRESPEMVQFRKDNAWYGDDKEMTVEADGLGTGYAQQLGLTGKALLDKVAERMKVLHAEKFSNQRRNEHSTVDSGEHDTGLPKKKSDKTFDNLPADAKKQCEKYVKQGLLTKEQYVADYEWE